MVREVGIHDDDEVAARIFKAVDVGGAETKFAGSGLEDDAGGGVKGLKLFGNDEGAVGGGVINDDELPVEVTDKMGLIDDGALRGW